MKILVSGTHFTPAQAVIEEFKKDPHIKVIYVGREFTREGDRTPSSESIILPKMGVKYYSLVAGRLQRSWSLYTIPSLLKVPIGFFQSFWILLFEKPDVVLSFGGYVGVPVVISAWLLSIPIIIHEQTLISGLANKISSLFADKIAVSFAENKSFNPDKTILTGNPIRSEVIKWGNAEGEGDKEGGGIEDIVKKAKTERLPLLLITGGNQGSHVINMAVKDVLPSLTKLAFVVHQCGDSKFNDCNVLEAERAKLYFPYRYLVSKWIDSREMGRLLSTADLIIARGGVNTLLEISYFGKPVLIIPLPVKEQEANAKYFHRMGGARVLWQKDLSGEMLLSEIKEGLVKLDKEAVQEKKRVYHDAAKRVALETILLTRKS